MSRTQVGPWRGHGQLHICFLTTDQEMWVVPVMETADQGGAAQPRPAPGPAGPTVKPLTAKPALLRAPGYNLSLVTQR